MHRACCCGYKAKGYCLLQVLSLANETRREDSGLVGDTLKTWNKMRDWGRNIVEVELHVKSNSSRGHKPGPCTPMTAAVNSAHCSEHHFGIFEYPSRPEVNDDQSDDTFFKIYPLQFAIDYHNICPPPQCL